MLILNFSSQHMFPTSWDRGNKRCAEAVWAKVHQTHDSIKDISTVNAIIRTWSFTASQLFWNWSGGIRLQFDYVTDCFLEDLVYVTCVVSVRWVGPIWNGPLGPSCSGRMNQFKKMNCIHCEDKVLMCSIVFVFSRVHLNITRWQSIYVI